MNKLNCLKYYTGGGFGDNRDVNSVGVIFHIYRDEISCSCSIMIGNKNIEKIFTNKNYSILDKVVDLLNTVNYDEIGLDVNREMWMDAPSTWLEYRYDGYEETKKLQNPNCKGLVSLLQNFLDNYLLRDEELQAIFKAIVDCDNTCDYIGLKYIIKNNNEFDINKDYQVDKINTNKPDLGMFDKKDVTNQISNRDVTVDDLLAEIDEKLKELEDIDEA